MSYKELYFNKEPIRSGSIGRHREYYTLSDLAALKQVGVVDDPCGQHETNKKPWEINALLPHARKVMELIGHEDKLKSG